jgi:hypothetical protein
MTARASAKRNEAAATERRVDFIFMGLILFDEINLATPEVKAFLRKFHKFHKQLITKR